MAGFIGSPAMNLAVGRIDGESVQLGDLILPLRPDQRAALTSDAVTVGVRPEGLNVVDPAAPGLRATIEVVEELGSDTYLYADAHVGAEPVRFTVRREGLSDHAAGEEITLQPLPGTVHLFDTASGLRLPD